MGDPGQKAVVLVSGGLDSCVTAAIARLRHQKILFLHVNYGQRTEAREKQAFHELADHWNIRERMDTVTDPLRNVGGSSLTDPGIEVSPADLKSRAIPTSYVPFRNAHLLAAATSWAEVSGAGAIYIGAVEEDSSGYPDCRPAFYEAFNTVIHLGTRPDTRIRIETPIIEWTKKDIVRKGVELNAPLHLTWSCYRNAHTACGACDSCALRLRGFQQARVTDPIPYAASTAPSNDE